MTTKAASEFFFFGGALDNGITLAPDAALGASDAGAISELVEAFKTASDSAVQSDLTLRQGPSLTDSFTLSELAALPPQHLWESFTLGEQPSLAVTLVASDSARDPDSLRITSTVTAWPTGEFTIQEDGTTPVPSEITWLVMPELGSYVSGKPLRSGRPRVVVTWPVLAPAQFTQLMYFYGQSDPPWITMRLPSPRAGVWMTYWGLMSRPEIGSRETVYFLNVTCEFSWLTPPLPAPVWPQPQTSYP